MDLQVSRRQWFDCWKSSWCRVHLGFHRLSPSERNYGFRITHTSKSWLSLRTQSAVLPSNASYLHPHIHWVWQGSLPSGSRSCRSSYLAPTPQNSPSRSGRTFCFGCTEPWGWDYNKRPLYWHLFGCIEAYGCWKLRDRQHSPGYNYDIERRLQFLKAKHHIDLIRSEFYWRGLINEDLGERCRWRSSLYKVRGYPNIVIIFYYSDSK